VRSFADYTLFNTQNPDMLAPKAKKPMPFPLENLDADLGDIYSLLTRLMDKLEAADQNPINNTKARKSRLESLKLKTNVCLRHIKDISTQSQELFY
jgi:hypothetical protein